MYCPCKIYQHFQSSVYKKFMISSCIRISLSGGFFILNRNKNMRQNLQIFSSFYTHLIQETFFYFKFTSITFCIRWYKFESLQCRYQKICNIWYTREYPKINQNIVALGKALQYVSLPLACITQVITSSVLPESLTWLGLIVCS